MLKRHNLGSSAVDYISSQLQQGDSFAKSLLQKPFAQGSIYTCLPDKLNLDKIEDFEHSLDLTLNLDFTVGSFTFAPTLKLIADHLSTDENICIFETYEDPDTVKNRNRSQDYFIYKNEVYYCCVGIKNDFASIEDAMKFARAYPFICGLSTIPSSMPNLSKSELTETDLLAIARETNCIIVGAFDDEGYVIWDNR